LRGLRIGDELAAHYASLDLFLFPSLTETFGNVTPEAMAARLPVVAFRLRGGGAGSSSMVSAGRLVPFGDASAFVRESLALATDRAQRAAMGPAATRGRGAPDLGQHRRAASRPCLQAVIDQGAEAHRAAPADCSAPFAVDASAPRAVRRAHQRDHGSQAMARPKQPISVTMGRSSAIRAA
jgi:hypothetical protein